MKIRNKLRKGSRRALSIVLCLVMLLSSFCLFEIGSFISSAFLNREERNMTSTATGSSFYAEYSSFNVPEMIYISPGGNTSQYFLNPDLSEPTSSTGVLDFEFKNAVNVDIKAKLYDSNISSVTSKNRITKIILSDSDGAHTIKSQTNEINVLNVDRKSVHYRISSVEFNDNESTAIQTSSVKYFIEWNITYKTSDNKSYSTVAYTGVRFPYLGQAGMAVTTKNHIDHWPLSDYNEVHSTYSFITGIDNVSGGNAKSQFLNTVPTDDDDQKITDYTDDDTIAPLLAFDGSFWTDYTVDKLNRKVYHKKDGGYTMPGGNSVISDAVAGVSSKYFSMETGGGVFLAVQDGNGSNVWYVNGNDSFTPIEISTPGYSKYNNGDNGYGMAHLTFDSSRFTRFEDIPNLRCGWASFGRNYGGNHTYIQNIINSSYTDGNAGGSTSYTYDAYDLSSGSSVRTTGKRTYITQGYGKAETGGRENHKSTASEPNRTNATLSCDELSTGEFNTDDRGGSSVSLTRGVFKLNGDLNTVTDNLNGTTGKVRVYPTDRYNNSAEIWCPNNTYQGTTRPITIYNNSTKSYTTYMRYEIDTYMGSYDFDGGYNPTVTAVGFEFTPVNKSAIRTELHDLQILGISNAAGDKWETIKNYIKSYSKYLGDSEDTVAPTDICSKTTKDEAIGKCEEAMSAKTVGAVLFNVPETIYLKPATGTSSTFQYELDNYIDTSKTVPIVPNEGYKTIGSDVAYGSIYFSYRNATNITLTCVDGYTSITLDADEGTVSGNKITNTTGNTISARITAGSAGYSAGSNVNMKWEVKYFDTTDHMLKTATAYTKVYSQCLDTTAAGGRAETKNSLGWWHSDTKLVATAWTFGIHGIDDSAQGDYAYKFPHTPAYSGCSGSSAGDIRITGKGMVTGDDYSNGGSKEIAPTGGTALFYLDISRMKFYSQIPYFKVGIDINFCSSDKNDVAATNKMDIDGNSLYSQNIVVKSNTTIYNSWDSTNDKNNIVKTNGSKIEISPPITVESTEIKTKTVNVYAEAKHDYESRHQTVKATLPIKMICYSNNGLRESVYRSLSDNAMLQEYFYDKDSAVYTKFATLLELAQQAVGFVGKVEVSDKNPSTGVEHYHYYITPPSGNSNDLAKLKTDLDNAHTAALNAANRTQNIDAKQYNVFLKNDPSNQNKYIVVNDLFDSSGKETDSVISTKYNTYDYLKFSPGVNNDYYKNAKTCVGCRMVSKALTYSNGNVIDPIDTSLNYGQGKSIDIGGHIQSSDDICTTNNEEKLGGALFDPGAVTVEYEHAKRYSNNVNTNGYYYVYFYVLNQYKTYFDMNDTDYDGDDIPVNLFSVNKYNPTLKMFDQGKTYGTNGGVEVDYDPVSSIITLHGTVTGTVNICDIPFDDFPDDKQVKYKITAVGGSVSNFGVNCFDLQYNGEPDNVRTYSDIYPKTNTSVPTSFTSVFPDAQGSYILPKLYSSHILFRFFQNDAATVFNHYQIRVELVETEPSDYAYSPYMILRNYDENISTDEYPIPERSGYDFLGWFKDKACTTPAFDNNGKYNVTADTTLYAGWKARTHDVLFDNLFDFDNYIKVDDNGKPTGTNIRDSEIYKDLEHKRPTDAKFTVFNAVKFSASSTGASLSPTVPIKVTKDHTYRVGFYGLDGEPNLIIRYYSGSDGKNGTGTSTDYPQTNIGSPSNQKYEWKASDDGYISLVLGIKDNSQVRQTELSNIYVQDITDPSDLENISTSEPFMDVTGTFVHTAEFTCGDKIGNSVASVRRNRVDLFGDIPTVTREGWVFDYWKDQYGNIVDENTLMTRDETLFLTSNWKRSSYDVEIDLCVGLDTSKATVSIENTTYFDDNDDKATLYGYSQPNTDGKSGFLDGVHFGSVITLGKVSCDNPNYVFAGWSLSYEDDGDETVVKTERVKAARTARWRDSENVNWKYCLKNAPSDIYSVGDFDNRFALTGDLNRIYLKDLSPTVAGKVKLNAHWEYIGDAEKASADFTGNVTYGYSFVNNEPLEKSIGTYLEDLEGYGAYNTAKTAYDDAIKDWKKGDRSFSTLGSLFYDSNGSLISKLEDAGEALTEDIGSVITEYLDNFTVVYNATKRDDGCSVRNINLNYYSYDTLDDISNDYSDANKHKDDAFSIENQNIMNGYIAGLAKEYAEYELYPDLMKDNTAPNYTMYDKTNQAKTVYDEFSDNSETPNYVYPKYAGDNTYYCYTNSLNPTVVLTVDDIADTSISRARVSYPTSSTITSNNAKFTYYEKKVSAQNTEYDDFLDLNIGVDYDKTLKGEYYNKKSLVVLKPDFSSSADRAEAVYTITAHDDANTSLSNNTADLSKLKDLTYDDELHNVAASYEDNVKDIAIKVYICYHNSQYGVFESDESSLHTYRTGFDAWCSQFRLYRTAGGASNWEYPNQDDGVYKMYDRTFDTYTTCGSFAYVFDSEEIGSGEDKIDLNGNKNLFDKTGTYQWGENTDNTFQKKIISFFKSSVEGTGTKFNKKLVWDKIGDTGYANWPGKQWNLFFYPETGQFVYAHLIDRWGNVHNFIQCIGGMDYFAVNLSSIINGFVELTEDGGSGVNDVTVNGLSNFDIITDDYSTYRDNVYTTTGDTIKLSTGQPNKEFKLNATDIATNSSNVTVKTDSDGMLELKVNDLAYAFDRDAYTFTLNGKQINLFSGVTKHLLSVEGCEVPEGHAGAITVRTSADIGKVQMVDSKGDTMTITNWDSQVGNVKTWTLSRTLNPGEHEFKIRVKVGNTNWLDEYLMATITVTTIINDTGRILDVSYPLSKSIENTFTVKVEGRARKIQFVDEKNNTWTFYRDHKNVQSIISYNADGQEIDSTARLLAYEVWTIDADLRKGKYTAIGKFGDGWLKEDENVFPFEIVYAK